MGRGSSTPAPEPVAPTYTTSEIKYGDKVIGKTYQDPITGNIVTEYYPDSEEEERKALLQEKINSITSTIGKTDDSLAQEYSTTAKAFAGDAQKQFLEEYTPALSALRENVASRFGSLNNSQFFDNLNSLEKNRSSALADIATKAELLKTDLVNQNEALKLSQLQTLGGTLNDDQSTFLNSLGSALSSSSVMNDFLNSQWMSKMQNFTSNQLANKSSSNLSSVLSLLKLL